MGARDREARALERWRASRARRASSQDRARALLSQRLRERARRSVPCIGPQASRPVMKALILCGGAGTRLRPYTTVIPKPLVPVGDYPILEVLLRQLRHAGVEEAILA